MKPHWSRWQNTSLPEHARLCVHTATWSSGIHNQSHNALPRAVTSCCHHIIKLEWSWHCFDVCVCVSGVRFWWRWGSRGTRRSSRVPAAACLSVNWVLWRRRALCTVSTAMRSSSPPPAHAANTKSWGSGRRVIKSIIIHHCDLVSVNVMMS